MPFGIDDFIAGAGLVSSLFGGGKEDPNVAIAREENARRRELYKLLMDTYNQRKSEGFYDPEKRITQLTQDYQTRSARDLDNLAGAARTAGYRPGDSAPQQMLTSASNQYRYRFDQMANDIRNELPGQELRDLSSINAGIQPYVSEPQQGDRYGSVLQAAQPFLSKWSTMLSGGQRGSSGAIQGAVDAAKVGAGYGFKKPAISRVNWARLAGAM